VIHIQVGRIEQPTTMQHIDAQAWLLVVVLTNAAGLLVIAWANALARAESEWALPLLYAGLLTLVVPITARLFLTTPTRDERVGLVVLLGLSLYLVKVLSSPTMFTHFDELLHWRTAHDVLTSGHLFQPNAMLPISPSYPGLEVVTTALVRLTGLPIFEAGIIVIGAARLLGVLALFLLLEEISDSARVGSIGALLYATNPGFIVFNAQFAYESLALPLGVFALWLLARRLRRNETARAATLATLLVLAAIIVTHHLTSFALAAFLLLLTLVELKVSKDRTRMHRIVALYLAAIVAWMILVAPIVLGYLEPYTVGAVEQIIRLMLNEVTARPLFTDFSGQAAPAWERVVSFGSLGLIVLGLPWGLWHIWRHHRGNAFALALGIASLAYIAGLPLRLLPRVSDVSARSAAFLFIAIAFVLALVLATPRGRKWTTIGTVWALVMFAGGYILGAGAPWARLPGPYLVSADARSIEPQGIAAAQWARDYLGPNNRISADRINSLLMGSLGLQRSVTHINDRVDISPLYFSADWNDTARVALAFSRIHYAVVDHRLSRGLPRLGVYFEASEQNAYQHKTPIALNALAKFERIGNARRVFDSGDIVIYDVRAVNE